MPNLNVIRPCDIIETIEAWECAINEKNTPTILVLTRQNVPLLRINHSKENFVIKGAYPIVDFEHYDATIFATGSEVWISLEAKDRLSN